MDLRLLLQLKKQNINKIDNIHFFYFPLDYYKFSNFTMLEMLLNFQINFLVKKTKIHDRKQMHHFI